MKNRLILILLICLLLVQPSPMVMAAESPNSIVNDLFPSEEEMNLQTGIEMDYKKVPPEHYKWDSNLKFAEWDGIFPELKNPGDVTENTIWAAVYRSGVSLVRFGIFLMQMGFSTNILTAALGEIDGEIAVVSDQFFTKVFPIASTMLVIFMIVAWVRGQKGQMVGMMLTAFIVSTLFIGGIKYIDTFAQATSDTIDELSLAALGILNFKTEGNYADGGKTRLAETGNIIWNVTVDTPWTAGQFGSLTAPAVLEQEAEALRNKGIAVSSESWKELFLRYAPGSIERNALVDILADEDIPHQNLKAAGMMKELAPPVRTFVSLISFLNSLGFLILAIVVAGLMNISGILLLGGMVVSPFIVPLPFLAGFGMNLVRKYLGNMIAFALLKVTALIYLSVLMLLLYLVSLVDFHFLIIQGLTLIILGVAIYLSPKIWKRMAPGLATLSGISSKENAGSRRALKRVAPSESLENLYERYGAWRHERGTEQQMEKTRMNRLRDTRTELESLQELKHGNGAQFAVSGLEQREEQLKKELRKEELSKMSLNQLQNERFKYENKAQQGKKLSESDVGDLKMIQQQEQQRVRSLVKPEQRKELDQIWSQQRQLYQQKLGLQREKATNPLLYTSTGGEAKMQHLIDKEQLLQNKERGLLRENSLYNEKKLLISDTPLTSEERSRRDQLREFLNHQQGDSMMKSHLSNESPELAMPESQTHIESLSHEELQLEQDKYHTQIENGVQLSEEQKNDYLQLQHYDWMNSLQEIDDVDIRQEVGKYHLQELNHESELINLNHLRETDQVRFEKMGGEQKRQELQQNLYQARQQSQEVLRKNGHREMAERHALLAENRDIIRGDSSKKLNKVTNEQPSQPMNEIKVENMSANELKQQQEKYQNLIKQGQGFTTEEREKFIEVQHHDWTNAISTLDNENLRAELDSNFIQELDYEAELAQFDQWRVTEPERFESMGGETKRTEIEQSRNQIKQQTQEMLRNNGYSQIADHHVMLAENRETMRELPHVQATVPVEQVQTQEINITKAKQLDDGADLIWSDHGYDDQMDNFQPELKADNDVKSQLPKESSEIVIPDRQMYIESLSQNKEKIIEMNDYRKKQEQPEQMRSTEHLEQLKQVDQLKLRENQEFYTEPKQPTKPKVEVDKKDLTKMTVAEYVREQQQRLKEQKAFTKPDQMEKQPTRNARVDLEK